MISSASPPPKNDTTGFYISNELNTKTRFRGFKVEVVELSTTAPYSPLINSLRGYSDTLRISKALLKSSFKKSSIQPRPLSFALELKTIGSHKPAGLLTFELKSKDKLYINGLGIIDHFQRKGLGTLLMSHAIEIAQSKGIRKVELESDQRSLSFYKNKIGMSQITSKNLMQLNVTQSLIPQSEEYTHSLKKLPQVIHVTGKSKYIP